MTLQEQIERDATLRTPLDLFLERPELLLHLEIQGLVQFVIQV